MTRHARTLPPTRNARDAGFTLVEMMVVILIIGLLATVVALNVLPSQDRARVTKAAADIATLESALDLFRLDIARYPTTDEGLEALVTPPARLSPEEAARFREGGYVRSLPQDPWGRPYQFISPAENAPFDLYSLGADGRPGGQGNDADIRSGQ
jgi:general secretion pathway protein G